jgi:hypothetical protein
VVRGESLFGLRIKLSGARVPLNGSIELRRVEGSNHARNRASSRGASCSTAFSMSSAVVMTEI